MQMSWQQEALALIAQMKLEASKPRRQAYDNLAMEVISQDCIPLKMADNLNYWLNLHLDNR